MLGLVPVGTRESCTSRAVVRGNAALPVFWFSRTQSSHRENFATKSTDAIWGEEEGVSGKQMGSTVCALPDICYRKLTNELCQDQRKRKKPTQNPSVFRKAEETRVNLNDHWWLKSLKAIYANVAAINSTKACREKWGCEGRDGQLPASGGKCTLMEIVYLRVCSLLPWPQKLFPNETCKLKY